MRFDWKPESKERYFRKAEAAVKAAGFDDILRVDRDQFFRHQRNGQGTFQADFKRWKNTPMVGGKEND